MTSIPLADEDSDAWDDSELIAAYDSAVHSFRNSSAFQQSVASSRGATLLGKAHSTSTSSIPGVAASATTTPSKASTTSTTATSSSFPVDPQSDDSLHHKCKRKSTRRSRSRKKRRAQLQAELCGSEASPSPPHSSSSSASLARSHVLPTAATSSFSSRSSPERPVASLSNVNRTTSNSSTHGRSLSTVNNHNTSHSSTRKRSLSNGNHHSPPEETRGRRLRRRASTSRSTTALSPPPLQRSERTSQDLSEAANIANVSFRQPLAYAPLYASTVASSPPQWMDPLSYPPYALPHSQPPAFSRNAFTSYPQPQPSSLPHQPPQGSHWQPPHPVFSTRVPASDLGRGATPSPRNHTESPAENHPHAANPLCLPMDDDRLANLLLAW
eukprot:CAMPEP_0174234964 /NCGR_PEP_ID=MMETSP0417-20130205/4564_1 /TAXON_ID=242541 /ORGANISM="Mayorella sp, Strain BSH-02190019" /LENGTH=383 /DNA_ID=CAMNT_0015313397 /DNA_START=25 /DNA_END=1173 /DNA_ORIENTATION=-